MKSFAYRAVHQKGTLHKGTLLAENENELIAVLSRKKLELIDVKEKKQRPHLTLCSYQTDENGKLDFARQMEDLLRAGLPLTQALALILETIGEGQTKDRLTDMEAAVRSGSSIAKSLSRHHGWLDPVSLAIIEAGEKSGASADTFARLAQHLILQKELRRTWIRAVRYPAFLLAVAASVTSFMLLWVVPQIVDFLLSNGNALPLATRLLIKSAEVFEILWWLAPTLALLLFLGISIARHHSARAVFLTDGWFLCVPFLGSLWRKLALARFMGSLNLLLKSGLHLPDALSIAKQSLANRYLIALCEEAHESLQSGQSFSDAMRGLFSPYLLQLVKIGEKSGSLPKVLDEMARTTEKEAQDSLTSFLAALEPALTIIVGGLLAWVVLAVLGPLYSSLGPLSGSM